MGRELNKIFDVQSRESRRDILDKLNLIPRLTKEQFYSLEQ